MPLSFKKWCPQCLSSYLCFYIKFLSSHVESSVGKFFHLMRYSKIDQFHSYWVLFSMTTSCPNMIFPSSSSFGNIVWTGIFYNFWMSGHSLSKDPINDFTSASYLAIFLSMIRHCDSVMDFVFLGQLLNHMRCELWPSVCDYLLGYAKLDEDVFK